MDLSCPDLDWVKLAKAMRVPTTRVDGVDALNKMLANAFSEPGP